MDQKNRMSLNQPSNAEQIVRIHLAACYRLCALNQWDDLIYTHISAAIPGEPDHYLINPFGMQFDEITASSLLKVNVQGELLPNQSGMVNPTGFAIHGAIHRARPDAQCVMHLHNTCRHRSLGSARWSTAFIAARHALYGTSRLP
jgi:ribulose-5-phosphate 4-epimerase/fuculose-1-phosphate aldolase